MLPDDDKAAGAPVDLGLERGPLLDPDRPGPPGRPPIDEEALTCLAGLVVQSFTATPAAVQAGKSTKVRWSVVSQDCPRPERISLMLEGVRVGLSGEREIRPSRDMSLSLTARAGGHSRSLGRVRIDVDESTCSRKTFPKDLIRLVAQGAVRNAIREYNLRPDTKAKVSLIRDTVLEIDPAGIVLRVRLKADVNNFADPTIALDARIGLGVSNSEPMVWYKSFAVDVDWAFWVTGITLGITKIVEEVVDGVVERGVKSKLITELRKSIRTVVEGLGEVTAIQAMDNELVITVCPRS